MPLDKKPGDFIGREALLRRAANPHRKLAGLKLDGREGARHGDGVFVGKTRVGIVTSACISPSLGVGIAMARVAVDQGAVGDKIEIGSLDQHQKRLLATVVPLSFYDPEKKRPRG